MGLQEPQTWMQLQGVRPSPEVLLLSLASALLDALSTSNRKIQWVECSGKPGAPHTQQVFIFYLNIFLRLLASQPL